MVMMGQLEGNSPKNPIFANLLTGDNQAAEGISVIRLTFKFIGSSCGACPKSIAQHSGTKPVSQFQKIIDNR